MKRLKLKMLVTVMIGAFTILTMLLYITSENSKCDSTSSILCYYTYKDEAPSSNNFDHEPPRAEPKTGGGGGGDHRFYRFISKAQLFNFKFETTQNLGNLAAPLRTPKNLATGDGFTTPKNISRHFNFLKPPLVGNYAGKSFPPPVYNRNKKSSNESDPKDKYLYLTPKLINKFHVNKLKLSRSSDNFWHYAERQRNLVEGCRRYYNLSEIVKVERIKLDHILIDENRKILFCYVPKVACTNWKRIFMLLTGKAANISEAIRTPSYKVHVKNLLPTLKNYSPEQVNHILDNYVKFIFVRNPFERLLSAYRNKLEQHYESSKYFQARFGKYIIKKFRKNPSKISLEKGDDVTFSEFASYLLSSDSSGYNEHWQTVSNLCHPCLINYDLIGKYETLIPDSNFVLNYLNMNFSFPVLEKPSQTASSLNKYFKNVKKDVIYELYRIYEMDFRLFGYDLFKTLNW